MKITGTGQDETGAQYDIVITKRVQQPPAETVTTLGSSTTTNPGNLTLTATVRPVPAGQAQPMGAVDWSIDGEYIVTADLLGDGTATWVVDTPPGQHVYGVTFVPSDATRWAPSSAGVEYTTPSVKPWAGATTVTIGGTSYPYAGTNVARGKGQLVGFDDTWPNATTGVNEWGSEVAELDGKIIGSVVNGQRGGMAIQPGRLVLSGHEGGAEFLKSHAAAGASVTFRHG